MQRTNPCIPHTVETTVCCSLQVAVEYSIVNMPVPPIEQYWQNVFFSLQVSDMFEKLQVMGGGDIDKVRTNSGLTSQYIRPYCKTRTHYW